MLLKYKNININFGFEILYFINNNMVLVFEAFRGINASVMEKKFITNFFEELSKPKSYYSNLQLLYNNEAHFTTTSHRVCTLDQIKNLVKKYKSGSKIRVIGTVHHNNHLSNVLIDGRGQGVFVEDTYIRIIDEDGDVIHLLISPPKLHTPIIVSYKRHTGCDFPSMYIPPNI